MCLAWAPNNSPADVEVYAVYSRHQDTAKVKRVKTFKYLGSTYGGELDAGCGASGKTGKERLVCYVLEK